MSRIEIESMSRADLVQVIAQVVRQEIAPLLRGKQAITDGGMTEAEVAEYLGLSKNTLRQWRVDSRGPKYHKHGKSVRYHRSEIDAWRTATTVMTSEAPDAPLR